MRTSHPKLAENPKVGSLQALLEVIFLAPGAVSSGLSRAIVGPRGAFMEAYWPMLMAVGAGRPCWASWTFWKAP